jgi:tRNA (Thr-GGU) A37 N-methylase
MSESTYEVRPIGRVESPLLDRDAAPKQGDEGSPEAWLVFHPDMAEAVRDLRAGSDVLLLTWLDRARRDVLAVHPRDDPRRVQILSIDGLRVRVRHLEALDGTPIVDVKPVLAPVGER